MEYGEGDVEGFIELADALEAALPGVVVDGNPDGTPAAGALRVMLEDGSVLYEQAAGAAWPRSGEVVAVLQRAMDAPAAGDAGVGCM